VAVAVVVVAAVVGAEVVAAVEVEAGAVEAVAAVAVEWAVRVVGQAEEAWLPQAPDRAWEEHRR
jgi:hypothetical protein